MDKLLFSPFMAGDKEQPMKGLTSQVKKNQLFAELFIARFVSSCFPFVHELCQG